MGIIIYIIALLLIFVAVEVIFSNVNKQKSKELVENLEKEHIILRLPKINRLVGYAVILLFSAFLLYMIFFPTITIVLWEGIVMGFFILLGVFLVISSINWRIEIFRHKDYFIYRTSFCKTYTIHYNECISYELTENQIILKTDKKKFKIDTHVINLEFLIDMFTQYEVKEISN